MSMIATRNFFNLSGDITYFGLTKKDDKGNYKPLSYTPIGNNQTATLEPLNTIYVRVGADYDNGAVVTHVGKFQIFEHVKDGNTFLFDGKLNEWNKQN